LLQASSPKKGGLNENTAVVDRIGDDGGSVCSF